MKAKEIFLLLRAENNAEWLFGNLTNP